MVVIMKIREISLGIDDLRRLIATYEKAYKHVPSYELKLKILDNKKKLTDLLELDVVVSEPEYNYVLKEV